jgi:hypothetical protein
MANRSYLYSTNFIPGQETADLERRIAGISEWGWAIPIAFKLLLSGNPRKCRSLIFDVPEEIALVGDYVEGMANLLRFLDRVPHPHVEALRDEAQAFLSAEGNRNDYFVLECGELFEMDDKQLREQADMLLAEIDDLAPQMERAIAEIPDREAEELHPPGVLARLFGAQTPVRRDNSADLVFALGLGCWTNTLFFEPNRE